MNFCYSDESGTGNEPIATMAGIIVDAGRMHLTKQDWGYLLGELSQAMQRRIVEIKTADFYAGNGVWHGTDGEQRARIIDIIFNWLIKKKHRIVYSSVFKDNFYAHNTELPVDIRNIGCFLGFHVILAIQRYSQAIRKNKGYTQMKFDECGYDKALKELAYNPPEWSNEYYNKQNDHGILNQMIDVPTFDNSKHLELLQVADFMAFFLRRYAELKEHVGKPPYEGEEQLLEQWVDKLRERRIPRSHIYLTRGRNYAQDIFYNYAPCSIRDL